jgi:TfoX/Sxy family transcriptional regulator of competence genes
MTTKQSTVDYILEQTEGAGAVSARKMFGEYGLFVDDKMVAILGDDQLFVKATAEGREFVRGCEERPPYPGAKPCLYISGERWEDSDFMTQLIRITAQHMPAPIRSKRMKKA